VKPILPSFLPSFLALIAASLGPVEALAAQQQTIWVDVGNPTQGTGTFNDPFHSLSFAISQVTWNPGDIIKILGNDSLFYTDDPNQPDPSLKESFPITLPDGVTLEFVPTGATNEPRATFKPNVPGSTCFQIQGGTTAAPTRIQGHFDTNPPLVPDLNQGIVVKNFSVGVFVAKNPLVSNFSSVLDIDGVLFDGCKTGLQIFDNDNNDSVIGTLQRSRILGASGTLAPNKPLVNLQVNGFPSHLAFTLQQDVLLAQGKNLKNNAVNLFASQSGTTADLTLEGVTIQGRTDFQVFPPPPVLEIKRAGLKFLYKQQATGTVTINNTVIQDANGAGIYGLAASNAEISLFGNGDRIQNNGNQAPGGNPAMGPPFSRSGMMLIIHESGNWNAVDFMDSYFNDNKVHGVHLIGAGDPNTVAPLNQFKNVRFYDCQFRDDGQNPPNNEQAHGFFSDLYDVAIDAQFRRSRFSGNGTCGIQMFFDSDRDVSNKLVVSNSVFSGNLGNNGDPMEGARDIDPLTVISKSAINGIQIQLAQLTISDNPTPYGVSLLDKAMNNPQRLWSGASDAHNCIFDGNGRDPGSGFLDVAFFPLPPDQINPCPQGSNDLFCLMASTTRNCFLGDEGLTSNQKTAYTALSASPNDDFIDPDSLLDLQPWQDLGLVFPSQIEILDQGIDNTVPVDIMDFRGAPRLYDDPNIPNPQMQSGKDIGAFEKKASE